MIGGGRKLKPLKGNAIGLNMTRFVLLDFYKFIRIIFFFYINVLLYIYFLIESTYLYTV